MTEQAVSMLNQTAANTMIGPGRERSDMPLRYIRKRVLEARQEIAPNANIATA